MKLAILSRGPKSYSTQRLREAAVQRNHKVKVLNHLKFAIDLQKGLPDLYYRQKMLSTYDAVLPPNWGVGHLLWRFSSGQIRTKAC